MSQTPEFSASENYGNFLLSNEAAATSSGDFGLCQDFAGRIDDFFKQTPYLIGHGQVVRAWAHARHMACQTEMGIVPADQFPGHAAVTDQAFQFAGDLARENRRVNCVSRAFLHTPFETAIAAERAVHYVKYRERRSIAAGLAMASWLRTIAVRDEQPYEVGLYDRTLDLGAAATATHAVISRRFAFSPACRLGVVSRPVDQ